MTKIIFKEKKQQIIEYLALQVANKTTWPTISAFLNISKDDECRYYNLAEKKYWQGAGKQPFATIVLTDINEKGEISKIIKKLFDPFDYINDNETLNNKIADFNKLLLFENLEIIRTKTEISIKHLHQINTKIPNLTSYNNEAIQQFLTSCEDAINNQLDQPDDKQNFEPVILGAKSLIECLLNHIKEKQNLQIKTKNLIALYKEVAEELKLNTDPENNTECPLNKIRQNLLSLIEAIAELRNKQQLAHGTGKAKKYKPKYHHAMLAINSARTVAEFLISVYQNKFTNN